MEQDCVRRTNYKHTHHSHAHFNFSKRNSIRRLQSPRMALPQPLTDTKYTKLYSISFCSTPPTTTPTITIHLIARPSVQPARILRLSHFIFGPHKIRRRLAMASIFVVCLCLYGYDVAVRSTTPNKSHAAHQLMWCNPKLSSHRECSTREKTEYHAELLINYARAWFGISSLCITAHRRQGDDELSSLFVLCTTSQCSCASFIELIWNLFATHHIVLFTCDFTLFENSLQSIPLVLANQWKSAEYN